MTENILVSDIERRAKDLYILYKNIVKEDTPERWLNSELEFEIVDSNEINGKAKVCNGKDHIEINRGVISRYFTYFYEVTQYDKNQMLKAILRGQSDEDVEKCSYEMVDFSKGKIKVVDSKNVDESIASFLEINVSRFIVLHEFGHVFQDIVHF